MNPKAADAIAWLLLILPGFLSVSIVGLLIDLEAIGDLKLIVYSFAFTLVNLALALPLYVAYGQIRRFAIFILQNARDAIEFQGDKITIRNGTHSQKSPTSKAKDAFGVQNFSEQIPFPKFLYACLFPISLLTGYAVGIIAERDLLYSYRDSFAIIGFPDVATARDPLSFLLYSNTRDLLGERKLDHPFKNTAAEMRSWIRFRLDENEWYAGYPRLYNYRRTGTLYLSPACSIKTDENEDLMIAPIEGPGMIVDVLKMERIMFEYESSSLCARHWKSQLDSG